jgi:putative ABC transport system permease protein
MFRLLLRRHLATVRGASLVLALAALLTAAGATVAVREIADLRTRQVDHTVQHLTPLVRDVVSVAGSVPGGASESGWDDYLDGMSRFAATRPAPLRDVLGEPDFTAETRPVAMENVPSSGLQETSVVLRATPRLTRTFRLVDGAWPEATEITVTPAGPQGDEPVQVVVTADTARVLGWELGDVHASGVWQHPPLRLVGVVAPADPGADTWYHQPFGLRPQVVKDFLRGDLATAAAYTAPEMIGPLTARGAQTRLWYPVSTAGVGADDVQALAAQVRGMTHEPIEVVPGDPVQLQASTQLAEVLDEVVAERVGTDAVLAVLLVGPLGAVAAVMLLAARLVVERGRGTLAILRARGATTPQIRGLVALEGLAVSVPAAVAGTALGMVARPGPLTGTQVLLPAAAALTPAVAAATAELPRGLRGERTDLAGRRRPQQRAVAELLVVGLAVLAAVLLLRRGVVTVGVDPLLAATPLLVSAAGTVLALRAVPVLAGALERVLARRRDLVAFLGAAATVISPLVFLEIEHVITRSVNRASAHAVQDWLLQQERTSRVVVPEVSARWLRTARTVQGRYVDLGVDLADAVNVVLAEEYETETLLTLDRRDFRALRTLTGQAAFRLLPDDHPT